MFQELAVAWGTVPEWFAAVGTVGALIGGIVVLRKQLVQYNADAQQRKESQARAVYGWTVRPEASDPPDSSVVLFRNSSSQPIYRFMIFVRDLEGKLRLVKAATPLGAGAEGRLVVNFPHVNHGADTGDAIELEFDDAVGQTWRRDADGRLWQVKPDDSRRASHAAGRVVPR